MKKMIEVVDLTKKFGDFTAVDHISFSVDENDIFAFLGPNGAGKSTCIKIMTTVASPSSGEVKINGFDVTKEKNQVRESIGVIFQDSTLDEDLTAYENLYYHAVLYKVPPAERKPKIEKLLDSMELLSRKDEFVRNFSGGMRRRIEIARGLLHDPKVLFLDEPTLGLDVQTRSFLWNHVKEVNKTMGLTIFLTTHNMDEAEKIATKVAIIDHGKILAIGTLEEIYKSTGTNSLEQAFLKLTGNEIREQKADDLLKMKNFKL
ncbi:ABC transporter ATP-binding protein [Chitinophaga sp. LS1]|uniref:ABC transporter ATP-binding protein n=1 Tax=Chitinophaga sp. LS1 TaxID=3051176 RepID=UPI002AAB80AE|nr:ATP-binding cassette domain-containing protein [Chitinophaga sp. LS1]WPV65990.1 ATP-binding cassette domain-containing protein [Chitinophaga sp. LS1]